MLGALNHPNIAHIHGFEDSHHAIVMELVEGPTLAEMIAGRAMSLADALPIARQIAEAQSPGAGQGAGELYVTPVATTSTFSRGNPRKLFELGRIFVGTTSGRSWDVSRDGRRFIAIRHEAATATTGTDRPSFVFIVNFTEELRGKLGVNR